MQKGGEGVKIAFKIAYVINGRPIIISKYGDNFSKHILENMMIFHEN